MLAIKSIPPYSPPRAIHRTTYRGKTVYYITPACCDIPSELYDETGALICHPSGGFDGGDGRCADFRFLGTPATLVWQDKRGAPP